jgi:hypothetical protein
MSFFSFFSFFSFSQARSRPLTLFDLEIWRDTAGRVDGIALAAGTGGTIAGTSRYLKVRGTTRIDALMIVQRWSMTDRGACVWW